MTDNRRTFIRKTIWGGILSSLGLSYKNALPLNPVYTQPSFDNWQSIRDQFLLSKDRKFFNTASLGASPISVINKYDDWSRKLESTSETGHGNVKNCRASIAEYFNCDTGEIAITRNTTEGINIVANGLDLETGDEVLLTTHEHVGGAVPWLNLSKRKGIVVKTVDLDLLGGGNLKNILDAITSKTKVVSISHVTCTTGMVLPIKEIVQACRKKDIYTCIDGAQAPGMIEVDLKDMDPDFYATSGHKWLFGPKGTGVLYINSNVIAKLHPTFAGAYTNDLYDLNTLSYTFRSVAEREEYGTRNTPAMMALKEAFDFQMKIGIEKIEDHGRKLAQGLRSQLNNIPSVEIITPESEKFNAAIVTFRSTKLNYTDIQKMLMNDFQCRVRGIYENNLDAIRISCALYNSQEEIEYLSNAVRQILSE